MPETVSVENLIRLVISLIPMEDRQRALQLLSGLVFAVGADIGLTVPDGELLTEEDVDKIMS